MATAAVQQATPSPAAAAPSSVAASAWLSYISRAAQQGALLPTPEEASALCAEGHAEIVAAYVYSNVESALRTQHIQAFWARLTACSSAQPAALEAHLLVAFQSLTTAVQAQSVLLQQLSQMLMAAAAGRCTPSTVAALVGLCARHRMAVSAVLISGAPFSLTGLLQQYYEHKLSMLSASMMQQEEGLGDPDSEDENNGDEDMADQENEPPGAFMEARTAPDQLDELGPQWAENLQSLAWCLRSLGLDAASEEAYTLVVNRHVADHLQSMAHKVFDKRVLPAAQRYVASAPLEFLKLIVGSDDSDIALLRLNEWRLRLTYFMLETLGQLRIKDMFDIIVDYPDSAPAVADMGECLCHTNLHAAFVREVREAVRARLLHAGAATGDIITSYVAAIRALREIDPSGMLLDAVAAPIRLYLRSRQDTIRCIVAMLTEDTELLEELEGSSGQGSGLGAGAGSGLGGGIAEFEGDEAALRMLEGMAAAQPGAAAAPLAPNGRQEPDIVAMLIGIYGSKELFISEYRSSLAQRLLAKADYDCTQEVRTLELLKMRFGDAVLHNCEIMIKDLGDSKRLNQTIRRLSPAANATGPGAAAPALSGAGAASETASTLAAMATPAVPLTTAATQAAMTPGLQMPSAAVPASMTPAAMASAIARLAATPGIPPIDTPAAASTLDPASAMARMAATPGPPNVDADLAVRAALAAAAAAMATATAQAAAAAAAATMAAAAVPAPAPSPAAPLPAAATATAAVPVAGAPTGGGAGGGAVPEQESALAAFERLHATVASYLFWPELQEHELQLPPDMARALELYAERYHHVKAPRKLLWRPTLGLVELEVVIGDSAPLEFHVTPVHAAILLHFSDQGHATPGSSAQGAAASSDAGTAGSSGKGAAGTATANALATALGVPQAVVRSKALFWVNNGVLLESRGAGGEVVYKRAEALDPNRALTLEATDMSWHADSGGATSAEEKLIAEMSPYENFIIGILTNFSAVPLDRMHSLLRMFVVSEPKYDKSQEQLAAFLQIMAAREKVDIENGIYKRRIVS